MVDFTIDLACLVCTMSTQDCILRGAEINYFQTVFGNCIQYYLSFLNQQRDLRTYTELAKPTSMALLTLQQFDIPLFCDFYSSYCTLLSSLSQ